tara:strand:- start:6584 stop:8470 length:1887 start_codon:yes stop_codon:yes gene_type:complete
MARTRGETIDKAGADRWADPPRQCDLVMKGGITSGVVYPLAIARFAEEYRLRGVGGSSAGAIGAALAGAAEFGRETGGFRTLTEIPERLRGGRLEALFQAQPSTEPLLRVLFAVLRARPGAAAKVRAAVGALVARFPGRSALGALAGVLLFVLGVAGVVVAVLGEQWFQVAPGAALALAALALVVVGWALALAARMVDLLTVAVPQNLFGICRGLGAEGGGPGFTDWLSDLIDEVAGLPSGGPPLTFGQLWGDDEAASRDRRARDIDLRLITTCLSRGRPYEMPLEGSNFFFDPDEWATLFPPNVMASLLAAPAGCAEAEEGATAAKGRRENQAAKQRGLVRLPEARDLPVIVAVRMSLSFPLLISAIPLHAVRRRRGEKLQFEKLWFTDGGMCSNFPLHLFESPLPTRPTFAINLGSFRDDAEQHPTDESENIVFATRNSSGIHPPYQPIAEQGVGALVDFAGTMLDTSRNWQDNSYVTMPGYRDRIVRVQQTSDQGGLNLNMSDDAIERLARRGEAAASALIDQFTKPHYRGFDGWANHRWVRYRALMATLPEFLGAYRRGRAELHIDPTDPPGFDLPAPSRALAGRLSGALTHGAEAVAAAPDAAVESLTESPKPRGSLRRVARI